MPIKKTEPKTKQEPKPKTVIKDLKPKKDPKGGRTVAFE